MKRARNPWLPLLRALSLLALGSVWAIACGGPQKLGAAGSVCFRTDDCADGLACVPSKPGSSDRVCSGDLTGIVSMVDGAPLEAATPVSDAASGTGGTPSAGAGGAPAAAGGGGKPATGGVSGMAGAGTAGKSAGGAPSGGAPAGGAPSGGAPAGGAPTAGAPSGGAGTAGTGTGGGTSGSGPVDAGDG